MPEEKKKKKKIDREILFRMIKFCDTIKKMGEDPFEVNIKNSLDKLKEYLPRWKKMEDLLLDAEAIEALSIIIQLQGKWVKDRSSSFYFDLSLIEKKVKEMDDEQLAKAFLRCWHPIVAMDRLTLERLQEGIEYWNRLLPLEERIGDLPEQMIEIDHLSIDDLSKMKILSDEQFSESIKNIRKELDKKGKVNYWDFIRCEEFDDTITKAYLTSYLVTDGYADIEINPLEDEIFLIPMKKKIDYTNMRPRSIPISISCEKLRK